MPDLQLLKFGVALGIGLLVGIDRERSKGSGPGRAIAGLRTFAVTALLGAVCMQLGDGALLAVAAAALGLFCVVSIRMQPPDNPGLTTEVALLLTLLLGALAMIDPALAGSLGVALAALLAFKSPLHHFVKAVITERELNDALILAAASLVILPLLPDRHIGPFDAINPRITWTVAVLIMLVSALGHVATRLLGPRLGMPAAGLASGFVSSTATIAAMGSRAVRAPRLARHAATAAVMSSVSTVVQLALVLAAISLPLLRLLALPLLLAGIAALAYALVIALAGFRAGIPEKSDPGPAFSVKTALALAMTLAGMVLLVAACEAWMGPRGMLLAATLSGFADAHAAASSVASLFVSGRLEPGGAVIPILAAFSANTVSKALVAFVSGGWQFARYVMPGLVLMLMGLWAGVWLGEG